MGEHEAVMELRGKTAVPYSLKAPQVGSILVPVFASVSKDGEGKPLRLIRCIVSESRLISRSLDCVSAAPPKKNRRPAK